MHTSSSVCVQVIAFCMHSMAAAARPIRPGISIVFVVLQCPPWSSSSSSSHQFEFQTTPPRAGANWQTLAAWLSSVEQNIVGRFGSENYQLSFMHLQSFPGCILHSTRLAWLSLTILVTDSLHDHVNVLGEKLIYTD